MRCPNCGHENNELATRCAACGAALHESKETLTHKHRQKPVVTGTLPVPNVRVEPAPTTSVQTPSPLRRLGTFLATHQRALGIGLAVSVLAVLGGVILILSLADVPTYEQIQADVERLLPSYNYAGGTYGPDLEIPLSSVKVSNRSATHTPEGMEAAGVGPSAYAVELEATYDDGKMRVVHGVAATYVRTEDGWQIGGELADLGTSLAAQTGVDEEKVVSNMGSVLQAASGTGPGAGAGSGSVAETLADIYEDGSFQVVGNDFEAHPDRDTATDTLVVHCTKDQGFYAYEGNVTAQFAFESGAWQLRGAEADASAETRTYRSLVGTWSGELVSHDAVGGSCFGAQEHPVRIVIASMGDASEGSGQVQGTISCVGHFHERLEDDEASDPGDQLIEGRAFWGEVSTSRNRTTGSNLNLECATAGGPDGELDFVLSFGTDDDPGAVVASVTCTHTYEETIFFLLPHQTTARFTDTYVLSRVG